MSHFLLFNIPCSSNMQYFNLCVSYCRFDFRILYCNSLEIISSQYNYQVIGLHKILCQMIWCLLNVLASSSISALHIPKIISVQFERDEFCHSDKHLFHVNYFFFLLFGIGHMCNFLNVQLQQYSYYLKQFHFYFNYISVYLATNSQ